MIICLAKHAEPSLSDLLRPTPRHVTIPCQQYPALLCHFSDYFRIKNILPLRKMFIMCNDTQAGSPQFSRQISGPKISISEDNRIRRQSM